MPKNVLFTLLIIIMLGSNLALTQEAPPLGAFDLQAQYARLREAARAEGEISIIVGFGAPLREDELTAAAIESQQAVIQRERADILSSMAGVNVDINTNSLNWVIPYVAMTVDEAGLEVLAANPNVTSIQRSRASYNMLGSSIAKVQAPAAWSRGYTGAGQAVVIIDTGIDRTHPFFGSRVVWEACFSGGGNLNESLCPNGQLAQTGIGAANPARCVAEDLSDCSHGTHVAGIAAGSGPSFDGVAPDASIISINASSSTGLIFTEYWDPDLISALNHVYTIRHQYSIAAVNMSLGGGFYSSYCDGESPAMRDAIVLLRSVRIATVAATGNDGYTMGVILPACISAVISVGASTDDDKDADFSNIAPFMTLYAPGVDIMSSVIGGGYGISDGTSMASPHVAGAVAVLRQAKPSLTVTELYYALTRTGPSVTYETLTKPRLDVNAALNWVLNQMVTNSEFNSGGAGWATFPPGAMTARVNQGVYEFYANAAGAVALQATGRAVPNNSTVEGIFLMGNSSGARQRVSVLMHDADFSDLQVCSFWLPPNTPLRGYRMTMKTREAWTNAMISFYPAQTGGDWLRIDNVLMHDSGNLGADGSTLCYDGVRHRPTGAADSTNLIDNGSFTSAITPDNPNGNWAVFGPIAYDASDGVFRFNRQGSVSGGVVFQNSGDPVPFDTVVEATFTVQNTSTTPMRFTILLHDSDFSDLNVCTFWLAPGEGPTNYRMYTHTTEAWSNAAISFYPSRTAADGWLVLDNVTLRSRGTEGTTGTECYPAVVSSGASAEIAAPTLEPTATPALPAGELPLLPTSMPEGMEAAESIQQEGMIGE